MKVNPLNIRILRFSLLAIQLGLLLIEFQSFKSRAQLWAILLLHGALALTWLRFSLASTHYYRQYKNKLNSSKSSIESESVQEEIVGYQNTIQKLQKKEQQLKLYTEKWQGAYEQLAGQMEQVHNQHMMELDRKEHMLAETKEILKEQRQVIEKKQQDINVLSLQVDDLKFELEQAHNPPHPQNLAMDQPSGGVETIVQPEMGLGLKDKLQKYIDMTTQLSHANPFAQSLKKTQFPFGSLMLDQRRLFDWLENEEQEVMFVYSMAQKRFIFVNQQVKAFSGWSPVQFTRDFPYIVQKGYEDWQKAINSKGAKIEEVRLLLKTHSGYNILTHCLIRNVNRGIFENHKIGVLSSVAKR